jgi:hypothetical protein
MIETAYGSMVSIDHHRKIPGRDKVEGVEGEAAALYSRR